MNFCCRAPGRYICTTSVAWFIIAVYYEANARFKGGETYEFSAADEWGIKCAARGSAVRARLGGGNFYARTNGVFKSARGWDRENLILGYKARRSFVWGDLTRGVCVCVCFEGSFLYRLRGCQKHYRIISFFLFYLINNSYF